MGGIMKGMPRFLRLTLAPWFLLLGVVGCRRSPAPASPSANTATYVVRGVVVQTMPQTGEVMLQHEAIPGFMEAMTMPYKLAEPNTLSELHSGDRLTARLRVERDGDGGASKARIDQIVVLAQAKPDYKPAAQYHVPVAGDAVPDFRLTDQDGKAVRLSQFRGKVLLVTFIYTRCPLSDFCPRMTRNFKAIAEQLQSSRRLHDAVHLLSISFDPAYDTPAVLRAYAETYMGKGQVDFGRWTFAAADKSTLTDTEHFFNVGATPGDGTTIDHSLATTLIDASGHVVAFYPGNEWRPDDVVARMREVVSASAAGGSASVQHGLEK